MGWNMMKSMNQRNTSLIWSCIMEFPHHFHCRNSPICLFCLLECVVAWGFRLCRCFRPALFLPTSQVDWRTAETANIAPVPTNPLQETKSRRACAWPNLLEAEQHHTENAPPDLWCFERAVLTRYCIMCMMQYTTIIMTNYFDYCHMFILHQYHSIPMCFDNSVIFDRDVSRCF